MPRSITVSKKPRGRPKTTGIGTLVGMRWHAADLDAIDAYARAEQVDRTEAIRRLVRLGLAKAAKHVTPAPETITRKVRLGLKRRGKA